MAQEHSTSEIINVGGRDFIVKGILGKGGFSTVLKGVDNATKKLVALKLTFCDKYKSVAHKNNQMGQVHKEIKTMRSLSHPNIIRLLGYDLKSKYKGRPCIVMVQELAPRRELFEYLMYSGTFSEKLSRYVFKSLCKALLELHTHEIAHRDLKPENLLFDVNFTLKVADFGFAFAFGKKGPMKTELGTRGYMAPEIMKRQPYTEKVDIFASGVILFILLCGFPPFRETKETDWWFNKILQGKTNLFWMAHERKASYPEEAKDLITKMLSVDPTKRPSIKEIMNHSWYNGPDLDKNDFIDQMNQRQLKVDRNRANKDQSRDVMADNIKNYAQGLSRGEKVDLRQLLVNETRDAFFNGEVKQIKQTLAGLGGFMAGLAKKLEVNDAEKLGGASDIDEVMKFTNLNEKEATKLLANMDEIQLQIPDYNHENTATYIALDEFELPVFDNDCERELNVYTAKCGLGCLALCLQQFEDQFEEKETGITGVDVDINDEDLRVDITVTIQEEGEFPEEVDGQVTWKSARITETLDVQALMYEDKVRNINLVKFVNASPNPYARMQEFSDIVTEMIAQTALCQVLDIEPEKTAMTEGKEEKEEQE